jgi:ParB family transcriptional regulator, chromosome partitioning protein
MTPPRRERLGRGLSALLGEYVGPEAPRGQVVSLPLSAIIPNPLQPRREFAPEELQELRNSIEASGLLQPLLVRPDPEVSDRYQLVAGERRFRAVTALGWDSVPVTVREMDNETLLVLALVENIQRAALSPLDEAEGYRTLMESFSLSVQQVAQAVGKDRSTVANSLRLLKAPASVRRFLEEGALSAGHVRALLTVENPVAAADLARQAVAEGWSVRQMEEQGRRGRGGSDTRARRAGGSSGSTPASLALQRLKEELEATLGTRVAIRGESDKGVIEIPFASTGELERLFALLTGREADELLG